MRYGWEGWVDPTNCCKEIARSEKILKYQNDTKQDCTWRTNSNLIGNYSQNGCNINISAVRSEICKETKIPSYQLAQNDQISSTVAENKPRWFGLLLDIRWNVHPLRITLSTQTMLSNGTLLLGFSRLYLVQLSFGEN